MLGERVIQMNPLNLCFKDQLVAFRSDGLADCVILQWFLTSVLIMTKANT